MWLLDTDQQESEFQSLSSRYEQVMLQHRTATSSVDNSQYRITDLEKKVQQLMADVCGLCVECIFTV